MLFFSRSGFVVALVVRPAFCSPAPAQQFSNPAIAISEAPSTQQFGLSANPHPDIFSSPARARFQHFKNHGNHGKGSETVNTIFSGVYPVLNVTFLGKEPQDFVAFIDTGSADTWAISKDFQCLDIETKVPRPQSACAFGTGFNPALGSFTNITDQEFSIGYFPENETLQGSMGYSPLKLGGLTVPKQEVAIVTEAAWAGDGTTAGLLGMAYPILTSASYRSNGSQAEYDPVFTTMVKEGIVKDAVFTLALDRVPQGYSTSAPAGTMAFGGLVSPRYYYPPFTSVPIELSAGVPGTELSWYSVTHERT